MTGFTKFIQMSTQHCFLETVLQCTSVSAWMHFRPFSSDCVYSPHKDSTIISWRSVFLRCSCHCECVFTRPALDWMSGNVLSSCNLSKTVLDTLNIKALNWLPIFNEDDERSGIVLQCPISHRHGLHSYLTRGEVKYTLILHLYILKHKCFDFIINFFFMRFE